MDRSFFLRFIGKTSSLCHNISCFFIITNEQKYNDESIVVLSHTRLPNMGNVMTAMLTDTNSFGVNIINNVLLLLSLSLSLSLSLPAVLSLSVSFYCLICLSLSCLPAVNLSLSTVSNLLSSPLSTVSLLSPLSLSLFSFSLSLSVCCPLSVCLFLLSNMSLSALSACCHPVYLYCLYRL